MTITKTRMRKLTRRIAFVALGFGLLLAALVISLILSKPALTTNAEPHYVTTGPNATEDEIVNTLTTEGYIKHPVLIRIALAISGLFHHIQAGGYYVAAGMSDWDIFRSLADPSLRYVKIEPGMRKQEIADAVGDSLGWDTVEKRELVNVNLDMNVDDLEGKYFPGTYLFPLNADPKQVGKEMTDNYQKEIDALAKKYPKSTVNYDTALEIASIIQREAAGKQDMRLISGVIWNRIFKGMPLSMDATVQYARGKTEGGWWAPIKASDIRTIDSPYNTYKNDGLPPTPISNPGADAIEAALNPQKTSCLFYIHDSNRQIHCSATYAGQESNIDTYLK
jgi:UPF0755 protein